MPRKPLLYALLILGICAAACTKRGSFPQGRWLDLSYDFSADTVYWPTASPFKLETVAAGQTEKGYYYSAYQFCAAEHGGTHIDAPVHFSAGAKSVDALPIDQLVGPALKVDVSAKAAANHDYLI